MSAEKIAASVKVEFEKYAKEEVRVEYIKGTAYGFCSELAALRILENYRNSKNVRKGFSPTCKQYYIALDLSF